MFNLQNPCIQKPGIVVALVISELGRWRQGDPWVSTGPWRVSSQWEINDVQTDDRSQVILKLRPIPVFPGLSQPPLIGFSPRNGSRRALVIIAGSSFLSLQPLPLPRQPTPAPKHLWVLPFPCLLLSSWASYCFSALLSAERASYHVPHVHSH